VASAKLTVPRTRRSLVERRELIDRLDGEYRYALISAPAGYAKTATLAAWAGGRERVAWLSCDPFDVEPTRFMSGLLSAIAAAWPGAADDALVLLDRGGVDTHDIAVTVANSLAGFDHPGVIVIDDLHLAAPDPNMLATFIDALPDDVRLVTGTRSDPPLRLGRLRLRGDLLELRSDDLRFSAAELAAFLELHGLALHDDDVHRLHELTEGWPAAAQMAAIALQGDGEPGEFLEAFATSDRSVADFLLSEVMDSLPEELTDFLVRTSVLQTFDADLCSAVTGLDGSAALIDRLIGANVFVVTLDERARTYRYHHLFGAFLRARLTALGPSHVRAARSSAATALEARGDVAGALDQALACGDVERAGQILRTAIRGSMNLAGAGNSATEAIRLWLHHRGQAALHDDPIGLVEMLIGLVSLSRSDDVPAWLDRVSEAHPDAGPELVALIEGTWGEYHHHCGQPLAALQRLRNASTALGGTPPREGMCSMLHMVTARAAIAAGDMHGARAVLEHALEEPIGNPIADDARHPAVAALVEAWAGELDRAEALAARAEWGADCLGLSALEPARIFAGLARVEVSFERNDVEVAVTRLRDVVAASEATQRLTLQALVELHRTRLARRLGDSGTAAALLAGLRSSYPDADEAWAALLDVEAAQQALRFEPSRATALIDALDPDRMETHVLRVRLALVGGDDRRALALAERLPPPTTRRERVERHLFAALGLFGRDVEAANVHVGAAIAHARASGIIRMFVDEGPDVHRLLKGYPATRGEQDQVGRLLDVTANEVAPLRATAMPNLVDPLSARELTVLRYLCSRLTYQEIAEALYVSLNTLKSHVRAVYRKLDASCRSEAVEAGRRIGLI
jgi:LuxR family maltose regulon positive regulatory protein